MSGTLPKSRPAGDGSEALVSLSSGGVESQPYLKQTHRLPQNDLAERKPLQGDQTFGMVICDVMGGEGARGGVVGCPQPSASINL